MFFFLVGLKKGRGKREEEKGKRKKEKGKRKKEKGKRNKNKIKSKKHPRTGGGSERFQVQILRLSYFSLLLHATGVGIFKHGMFELIRNWVLRNVSPLSMTSINDLS